MLLGVFSYLRMLAGSVGGVLGGDDDYGKGFVDEGAGMG